MSRGRALLAAVLLFGTTACDGATAPQAATPVPEPAPGVAQLWQVDALDDGGRPQSTVLACVDDALREQFLATRAKVNGRPCMDITPPGQKSHGWVLRCQTQGRWFTLSSTSTGDETHDFRLEVDMTPVFPDLGTVRQTRRFRRLGPCPAGWRIGDQAKPGERPVRRKS